MGIYEERSFQLQLGDGVELPNVPWQKENRDFAEENIIIGRQEGICKEIERKFMDRKKFWER